MNILPLDSFSYTFPNPLYACDEGILAYGGDLHPTRLLKAYTSGIFPWYNKNDPILWWSPNPRFVLDINEFKISKSLQKILKHNPFTIRFNTQFRQVMQECAFIKREGQKGSWIHKEVIEAFVVLHNMGFAHSFEAYIEDELVGGGYGVTIGNIFCGESMFAKKSNASKVAFTFLVQHLQAKGFKYIDCQIPTEHLRSFGAKEISREKFLELVQESVHNPKDF